MEIIIDGYNVIGSDTGLAGNLEAELARAPARQLP
jgi:predicted RNA-binding protein with PIN domain